MSKIDVRIDVYNALADIMFKTGADKGDMGDALRWFSQKFWEDDESADGEDSE